MIVYRAMYKNVRTQRLLPLDSLSIHTPHLTGVDIKINSYDFTYLKKSIKKIYIYIINGYYEDII